MAGHRGMVGSALVRALTRAGYTNLVTAPRPGVDLRDCEAVRKLFAEIRPDVVILAAAKVGGIQANRSRPAEFMYDNLAIQTNVIHESHVAGVRELVFLGSSCVYPRECPQPMKEEYLLTGPLEPTNEGYALAKIAGLRLAQYYQKQYGMRVICPMPSNLYGTNDNFHPENSHVLSALVRKFCDAFDNHESTVTVWGTGKARREFLHVDDLADAVMLLIDRWQSPEIINVGAGDDVSIRELAELIARKVGFSGEILWDTSMPDGMPRKLLDISKIAALGFRPRVSLEQGIEQTIHEYREKSRSQTP
ncbi:MAG: GDP-L-fucose synthase family protein [Thermoanaerobaculia bacterium]